MRVRASDFVFRIWLVLLVVFLLATCCAGDARASGDCGKWILLERQASGTLNRCIDGWDGCNANLDVCVAALKRCATDKDTVDWQDYFYSMSSCLSMHFGGGSACDVQRCFVAKYPDEAVEAVAQMREAFGSDWEPPCAEER